jgi:hypothetical protein
VGRFLRFTAWGLFLFVRHNGWQVRTKRDLPLATWVMLASRRESKTEPKPRRQVMKKNIMYVGLDVHKNSIEVALTLY